MAIKQWAVYIEEMPPEKWGSQLNELVNAQLKSAQELDLPADQYRRVSEATAADEK